MAIERTLSIIKPDAVAKNVIGQIYARFEGAGLKVIAAKMAHLARGEAEQFYAVHKARPFFNDLVDFMISGPVMIQVLQGENAIAKNRELMGATDPKKAEKAPSAPTSPTASTPTPCTAPTRRKPRPWKGVLLPGMNVYARVAERRSAGGFLRWRLFVNRLLNLLDFDLEGLAAYCETLGEKRFRAVQLYRWIHQKGESDFEKMSDLANRCAAKLAGAAEVRGLPVRISEHRSADGTIKWLFDVGGGNAVETSSSPRTTAARCASPRRPVARSAAASAATGHQGFSRNLTSGEIVAQLWFAEHRQRRRRRAAASSTTS